MHGNELDLISYYIILYYLIPSVYIIQKIFDSLTEIYIELNYILTHIQLQYIHPFYKIILYNHSIKLLQKLASLAGRPEGGHIHILYRKITK